MRAADLERIAERGKLSAPPLRPGRAILGMSAVLLPFDAGGDVDWAGFEALVGRTVEAGLVPAVNMDTGYVQLLDDATRDRVLDVAARHAGADGFAGGAFVADDAGAPFDLDAYVARDGRASASVAARRSCSRRTASTRSPTTTGSRPTRSSARGWTASSASSSDRCSCRTAASTRSPRTRRCSASTRCIGAKHSSLSRAAEWDRLAVRDRVRPGFHVFTGNDLAIDMVCYGSDYLLGLSAFAPEAFAERDRRWAAGDRSFHELNDLLQYLGFFAFRPPVPAYRHDAAMFLALRGLHHGRRDATRRAPAARQRPAGPRRPRRATRGDAVTARPIASCR